MVWQKIPLITQMAAGQKLNNRSYRRGVESQNITKMSRSNWKYTWGTENDLHMFFNKITRVNVFAPQTYRHKTINHLNSNRLYLIHQGKVKHLVDTSEYYVDHKLGLASKTRKPFFFRSKKKRNVWQRVYFYEVSSQHSAAPHTVSSRRELRSKTLRAFL